MVLQSAAVLQCCSVQQSGQHSMLNPLAGKKEKSPTQPFQTTPLIFLCSHPSLTPALPLYAASFAASHSCNAHCIASIPVPLVAVALPQLQHRWLVAQMSRSLMFPCSQKPFPPSIQNKQTKKEDTCSYWSKEIQIHFNNVFWKCYRQKKEKKIHVKSTIWHIFISEKACLMFKLDQI